MTRNPDALVSHILMGLYYRSSGQNSAYTAEREWVRTRAEDLGLPIRLPLSK